MTNFQRSGVVVSFGSLLLLTMPVLLMSNSPIIQTTFAQTDGQQQTSPATTAANDTSGQQSAGQQVRLPSQEGFALQVLATNFSAPYNILYGPDGALWITERVGKNITRVDPDTGDRLSSIPVPDVWQSAPQDGLMGMAFDPDFNNTHYIYFAYTYVGDQGTDLERQTKITRFTYNPENSSIAEPIDLISGLAGSTDHNAGRLTFGPDGMLYYTIGDQGKNYLANYCMNNEAQHLPTAEEVSAQNWDTYEGKVLRMNPDGSIPDDNPVLNGVRSHIFTYGHRNPQGISAGPDGNSLYISEHGDKSDDEVSRLQAGANYGWPYVSGFNDEQGGYQYVNWSSAENCEALEFSNIGPPPPELQVMNESHFQAENFIPPVYTFYTVGPDFNFTDPACAGLDYICWPTVAPSSLRLYTSDTIPGWNGTFLMTTLKAGRIFQLTLNGNGTALAQDPVELFRSEDRYRDVAFSPDGLTIYAITDSSGPAQAIDGGATTELWNPGSVLAFKYEGGTSQPS